MLIKGQCSLLLRAGFRYSHLFFMPYIPIHFVYGHWDSTWSVWCPGSLSYGCRAVCQWERHDATTANRQGNDVGTQYRSMIFARDPEQEQIARASRDRHQDMIGENVVTEIISGQSFPFYEGQLTVQYPPEWSLFFLQCYQDYTSTPNFIRSKFDPAPTSTRPVM